jgi:hypothetical protein
LSCDEQSKAKQKQSQAKQNKSGRDDCIAHQNGGLATQNKTK